MKSGAFGPPALLFSEIRCVCMAAVRSDLFLCFCSEIGRVVDTEACMADYDQRFGQELRRSSTQRSTTGVILLYLLDLVCMLFFFSVLPYGRSLVVKLSILADNSSILAEFF